MSSTNDGQRPSTSGGPDRACAIEELLALSTTERAAAELFDLLARSHDSPVSAARFRRQAAEARRNAERAAQQAHQLALAGDDRDV
jgi:hypothetical protein